MTMVIVLALFGIAVWNAVEAGNGDMKAMRWSVALYWAVVAIYWAVRVFEVMG